MVKKIKEWSEKINRCSQDQHPADLLMNGKFGIIELPPVVSNTVCPESPPQVFSHTVGPAGDASTTDKTDSYNTTMPIDDLKGASGVKRQITDDHAHYHRNGSPSNDHDHEYICKLLTEENEEEEDEQECIDRTKIITDMLTITSNKDYDYASLLRTSTQRDLSEQDIFMAIIQEMKERYY
ncbi:uncharacterized protein LOC134718093 [Mytilus trossulus]|uniref:uncharacterized protein LOC134718093 n=1 Tax=Mytilus trossulus TaxID=6551 RepID=UPI00300670A9